MIKKLKLLKLLKLLSLQDDYQSVEYFAKRLQVSKKTIYNYIEDIESCSEKYEVELIKKQGIGIWLKGKKNDIQSIFPEIENIDKNLYSTQNRREELYIKLLMLDEIVSFRELSEKYYVSKTSIGKDFDFIETELKKNNLYLERGKQGTLIAGKEQHIRNAKCEFLHGIIEEEVRRNGIEDIPKCISIIAHYTSKLHIELAQQMVKYIETNLCFKLGFVYYMQILIELIVMIDRLSRGNILVNVTKRPVATELHILKTYPVTKSTSVKLEKEMGINIPDIEIDYLNARISGVYHESVDLAKLNITPDSIMIHNTIIEMIKSLEDIFQADLMQDLYLIQSLINHFIPMILRVKNKIMITNPFISQIKQQYPAMFSVIWLACSNIEKNFNFSLSEHEVSFIMIHFQAALERINLSKKVAVVTGSGIGNDQLITNRIRRFLPPFDVIEMISETDFKKEYLKDFDLVISTTSTISQDEIKKPVIMVSPFITEADIVNINNFYTELTLRPYREGNNKTLLSIINHNTVYLNQRLINKDSILNIICDYLCQNGIVTDGFKESVFKRENLSPTEIGDGVAIPHGDIKYVLKTCAVIVTLQEPVNWGNEMVSIVILFAIDFSNFKNVKEIFRDIYYLMNSKEKLDGIKRSDNVNDIFKILQKK